MEGHGAVSESRLAKLKRCIVCEMETVEQFLDLGSTALANKFLTEEELATPELTYPLRVGFCHTCGHVQLTEIVPPSAMFEEYLYMSSASDTLKAHFAALSDLLVQRTKTHLIIHSITLKLIRHLF